MTAPGVHPAKARPPLPAALQDVKKVTYEQSLVRDILALRRTKAADRNMRKGVTEASIESDGIDVFVVYNGARIAKRTDPNNPQAGIWASLEPGYRVFYKDYPAKLIVECDDKIISSKSAFIDT